MKHMLEFACGLPSCPSSTTVYVSALLSSYFRVLIFGFRCHSHAACTYIFIWLHSHGAMFAVCRFTGNLMLQTCSHICRISLPPWVVGEMEKNPDLAYTDMSGGRNFEYISLGCDLYNVLSGRSPVQVYSDFMRSFRNTFWEFMGPTITVSSDSCGGVKRVSGWGWWRVARWGGMGMENPLHTLQKTCHHVFNSSIFHGDITSSAHLCS